MNPASNPKQNTVPVSPSPKGNIARSLRSYWWIPVSYSVPYLIVHSIGLGQPGVSTAANTELTMLRSHYSGLIGLAVATAIFSLWRLDCTFGARQLLHLSRDSQAKALVHILGMALWVCWVGISVVACMAYDQVHELVPNLPGLGAPI